MSKNWKKIVLPLVILIACLGVIAIESQIKIVHRIYDNFVLDNKNHYLPCEELPTEADVSRIVEQHRDKIRAIEQVNPGFVGVEIDTFTCPGQADLVIWYASHQNRLAIEEIIGGDTFFGVPYRLQNR
jgi:Holliday junction resolvasome RuvABC endonuclease subunit